MAESFPLDWPLGYKRTKYRKGSKFGEKPPDTIQKMLWAELNKLRAKKIVVSSNVPLRRDGQIYSEYLTKKIEEPGIAVYFAYNERDVVVCCDQYEYPWENMLALAKGIENIRGLSRWGISEFMDRAFSGFKAIPQEANQQEWFVVLGVNKNSGEQEIKTAYRKLAQVHHPDLGGTSAMFDRVTKAYQDGLKFIKS